jgi:hypothetical protein
MKKGSFAPLTRSLLMFVVATFPLLFIEACSQVGPYVGTYSGKIQDEIYTSPNNTFQFKVPLLLKPGAKLSDRKLSESLFRVAMSDDLCRLFAINEDVVDQMKISLDEYFDRSYESMLKNKKATLLERKKISTKLGESLYVRYSVPEGGPCIEISFVDGKRKEQLPTAESAMIIVSSGKYVYTFEYMVGGDIDWPTMKTRPVDSMLMDFFSGFRALQ